MNPAPRRCFRCEQLLCELGQALVRCNEIEKSLRRGEPSPKDYGPAKAECANLRALLRMHLDQHDGTMTAAAYAGRAITV
jgi:hypothetical protein